MIQIVIPAGGTGKRFAERGYTFPKPLIEIGGKPMIEIVAANVTPSEPHRFIFVCRQEHLQKFAMSDVLELVAPRSVVVPMRGETAGALCSVLLSVEHLEADNELLIVNGDQQVDISIDDFLASARQDGWDGYIVTFPSTHPKWSYVRLEDGLVIAAAEKRPISRNATAGIYYFRKASDFIQAAEQMLLKNQHVGGDFYVCPAFNEMVLMGKRVSVFHIARDQMHSLGTPEDLEEFSRLGRSEMERFL